MSIAGRIGGGIVDLDATTRIRLPACDDPSLGPNNLHGGPQGFSKVNWVVCQGCLNDYLSYQLQLFQ